MCKYNRQIFILKLVSKWSLSNLKNIHAFIDFKNILNFVLYWIFSGILLSIVGARNDYDFIQAVVLGFGIEKHVRFRKRAFYVKLVYPTAYETNKQTLIICIESCEIIFSEWHRVLIFRATKKIQNCLCWV